MTDSGLPKDDGKRPVFLHERRFSLSDPPRSSPERHPSALQDLQKGTSISRTMKIAAAVVMLLCILAIIRMWTSRQDAIAQKLTSPAGMQVISRSGPLDKRPLTADTLPELERQFRQPVIKFLSQQEILQGMPEPAINQSLSVTSDLVTVSGQSIALFYWQATSSNHKDKVFLTFAYGNHGSQTHRILCIDRKPIDMTSGRCGNTVATVFHLDVLKIPQSSQFHGRQ